MAHNVHNVWQAWKCKYELKYNKKCQREECSDVERKGVTEGMCKIGAAIKAAEAQEADQLQRNQLKE